MFFTDYIAYFDSLLLVRLSIGISLTRADSDGLNDSVVETGL
jgi:hypothetical protein